jgi:uncharacterized protein YehS (DUF1456 family)
MSENTLMTNNDVLRRIRFIFDYGDKKMMELFALGEFEASRAQVSDWLKRDEDPNFRECSDVVLARFLNGLIVDRRGRREGPLPEPEQRLDNNAIFAKLRIALSLKTDDLVDILGRAGYVASKHELSAFFRRPDNRHYRACKDQILRNFLRGLEIEYQSRTDGGPPMQ